jgi:hypothetical protein
MSAILAVKLGNSYGTSHAAIPTADELLKRLTKNQWEYYLNECLPGDELVLQKLSWYAKPRSRWIELVDKFQLPAKADKSSLVTKLLAASHKAEEQTTASVAKALLEAMQKEHRLGICTLPQPQASVIEAHAESTLRSTRRRSGTGALTCLYEAVIAREPSKLAAGLKWQVGGRGRNSRLPKVFYRRSEKDSNSRDGPSAGRLQPSRR